MTSRERFLAAVRGGSLDRVPVAPYCGNFGAVLAGIPISVYNTDPKKMAEAQIRAWEAVGQDVVVAQSDNYYIAEGFGCTINQPVNTTPNLTAPAVESLDQVDRLKVPDPWTDGRMPVYLEAVALLREHFGNEVAVRAPGTGPFSLASYLVGGTAEFLTQIALCEADEDREKEEQIYRVMELSSDALILFLKAALDAGSDTAQAGDSLASLSMISPAIYEKYVYPYEVKVFSALAPAAREKGAVTILHICGDTRKILPLMAKTGTDVLEIDANVELADARELAGPDISLMGNLEPTTVLFQGNPELVRKESVRCIESVKGLEGGFILGSGCEVVPGTAAENLKAMVDVSRAISS